MIPPALAQARPLSAQEAEAAFIHFLDAQEARGGVLPPTPERSKRASTTTWQDWLALDDVAFIDAAFRTLLGRAPDLEGQHYYLKTLAAGRSRILVLGDLRYGTEGRAFAQPTPGLRGRYLLHRLYRLGIAGWALRTLTAMVALPGLMADVERLWREAAISRGEVRQFAQSLALIRAQVDNMSAALRREIAHTQRQQAVQLGETLAQLTGRIDSEPWADSIVLLADQADAIVGRLNQIAQIATRALSLHESAVARNDANSALATRLELDKLYLEFEDRFRGTRADIKHRQSIYLEVLSRAGAGTLERPIVDVGSGRGELLELLGDAKLTARGVDLNAAMVGKCRAYGLDCTHADAIAYLEALEPGSLGAVTGFHIIEHLQFPVMVALFDASLRALASGGIVIFETPNPANIIVASRWFHLDPTHRNPLPAEMVSMIAESRGFTSVEIRELHPMAAKFAAQDEDLGAQLDGLFHGPQDYALVARKS